MIVKLLTEHHLGSLSLKRDCTGSPESALVKMSHCWKSHVTAQIYYANVSINHFYMWLLFCICMDVTNGASAWDFQQFGVLTCVDSDEPLQPPFKLRNSKWCSVSSLTLIEYSMDKQRLWSDCKYTQADLRLCWSHIPHCWNLVSRLKCESYIGKENCHFFHFYTYENCSTMYIA